MSLRTAGGNYNYSCQLSTCLSWLLVYFQFVPAVSSSTELCHRFVNTVQSDSSNAVVHPSANQRAGVRAVLQVFVASCNGSSPLCLPSCKLACIYVLLRKRLNLLKIYFLNSNCPQRSHGGILGDHLLEAGALRKPVIC